MRLNLKRFSTNPLRSLKSKQVLSILMSLQIGVSPLLAHANIGNANEGPRISHQDAYKDIDPVWQKYADSPASENFQLHFPINDPALDQDPFFMRSQAWSQSRPSGAGLGYVKTAQGLEISVPGVSRTLRFNLPLTPLQATEDFIFFSLDATSTLFQRAAGADSVAGEGIFFLSRADLSQQALGGKPAPLFFFPLAGQGWTGSLNSIELPQVNTLVVANQTDSVALELADVETLMKAEQMSLSEASALTARNRGELTNEMYPAPGMTAAFGLFFTGIDLQMPAKSLWTPNYQGAEFNFKDRILDPVLEKLARWMPFGERSANALNLPPELRARTIWVGGVLTGMLVASIVIKYAHPGVRKKLVELRGGAPDVEFRKNPLKWLKRETKETFDVHAAVSTVGSQIALVTFANCLELFLDSFMPTVAAADHTLVRRFLKNTFYFNRDSIKRVPVDSRTLVLGTAVMGGIDTAMVVVQYEIVVPWIAEAASHHASEDMQARIRTEFDPSSPKYKEIASNDEFRNGIAYLQVGAFSYSAESRAQVIDDVTKEVAGNMRARGLDPEDPNNQTLRDREIEAKVEMLMKQKNLPGSNQFLFDAGTLFSKIPKALGYRAPEGLQANQSYILETRFGLTKNALNKAIAVANEYAQHDSSPAAKEALELLNETAASMSFFVNGVKAGKAGIAKARDVRQQLTLLSYEGSVEYGLKALPETWGKRYSPQAAQAAGLFFRQALYSYLSKEGDNLILGNPALMDDYGDEAKATALKEVLAAHPEVKAGAQASNLSADLQLEIKLRTQIEVNRLARVAATQAKAEVYAPAPLDWMARRKQARALTETDARMDEFLKTAGNGNLSSEVLAQTKQRFFRDALARRVGLHIEDPGIAAAQGRKDYVDMIEAVDKRAEEKVAMEIKLDPNMARYFEKLSEPERAKMRMFMYANSFLEKYKEATTEMEMVKPTDPAQPGRFQKLRQSENVRNSQFLTRGLRTVEALWNDQAVKTDFSDTIFRSMPLAQDLFSSHRRLMKTILPTLAITYIWNYYAWQVHMPFSAFVVMQLTAAATILTPSQLLNRALRLNGLKAGDSIPSKAIYALPYAWLTFGGMFLILLYSGDMNVLFSDFVRTPVMSVLGQMGIKEWLAAAGTVGVASALGNAKIRSDFKAKTEAFRSYIKPRSGPRAMTCEQLLLAQ